MTWNYRIVLHDTMANTAHHWHGLHAVYYENGVIVGWNADPEQFVFDADLGPQTIIDALARAHKTVSDPGVPVLKLSEIEPHADHGEGEE